MTRSRWRIRDTRKWLLRNREFLGEALLALLLSGFIIMISMCSINRIGRNFKDIRLQGIYDFPGGAGSLVLYEKGGVVQGREFQDCLQARYFAEAFK